MKFVYKAFLLVVISVLFIKCSEEEEVTSRDYPRLHTLQVSDISENGAKFSAEIIFRGDFKINAYGFWWNEGGPRYDGIDRVTFFDNIQAGQFSAEITTTLKEGVTYIVKPFVVTDDYTVFGQEVKFESQGSQAPTLTSIAPLEGTVGDTLMIRGEKFSFINSVNEVYLDDIMADVIYSSDTLVKAIVPSVNRDSYQIVIKTAGEQIITDKKFTLTTPKIEAIEPLAGTVSDILTIRGENFSHKSTVNEVYLDEIRANVFYSSDTIIKATVPPLNRDTYQVSVMIAGKQDIFAERFVVTTPVIASAEPLPVAFGETVTLRGDHFSHSKENNQVVIDGQFVNVLTSTKNEIKFVLPDALNTAPSIITVEVAGKISDEYQLAIAAPELNSVSPSSVDASFVGNIKLGGKNFNSIPDLNKVSINQVAATVLEASAEELTVAFPEQLISEAVANEIASFDITVNILGQEATLNEQLLFDRSSRWTRMQDFPGAPRMFGTAFGINGKGYVGMGSESVLVDVLEDFWEYDPATDTWTRLNDFPGSGRSRFVTLVMDGKAYLIAGTKGNPYVDENNLNEVWEFDPATNRWTQKNDFPGGARWNAFGFVVDGTGFVGGGVYGNYEVQYDFWKYDNETDSWTKLNDLAIGLWNEDALGIANQDNGYVLTESKSSGRAFWSYDASADTWARLADMPEPYTNSNAFVLENNLYVGTGKNIAGSSSYVFQKYDPSTDLWESLSFGRSAREHAMAFSLNGYGYVLLGGSEGITADKKDIWQFKP
ncbi:MAG: IPT/TIG domain-containing protein [Cyclobacteriaceae bacterium]